MTLRLFNTLTRKKEVLKPIKEGVVGMYSCGPTVWNYAHIGNFRTYIFNDLLKRVLQFNSYSVKHVMNITDVDDRIIKVSKEESIPFRTFTSKYEKIFFDELDSLNVIRPNTVLNATESIKEMVVLIKKLLDKGYAYKAEDGIYFSISKFKDYGKLAGLDKINKTKERVLSDKYDKDNAQDFALWKFYTEEDGDVYWDTELGKGRPGWHIECSAMSTAALGDQIDIHTGAIDLIFPHHTNEIAQSEAATGKKFVKYWIHAGFLNMKDAKMSKSLGNILTLHNLVDEGYLPIHFRYFCLLTHYRKPLTFTLKHLDAAKSAYEKIKRKVVELQNSEGKGDDLSEQYRESFMEAVNDDLNMPKAVQVMLKVLEDKKFDSKHKLNLLYEFDSVLGLGLKDMSEKDEVASEISKLVGEREKARKSRDWKRSDELRKELQNKGFSVEDSPTGARVRKI